MTEGAAVIAGAPFFAIRTRVIENCRHPGVKGRAQIGALADEFIKDDQIKQHSCNFRRIWTPIPLVGTSTYPIPFSTRLIGDVARSGRPETGKAFGRCLAEATDVRKDGTSGSEWQGERGRSVR